MVVFPFLIGSLIGLKSIILLFTSMFLGWLTDIFFIIPFGLINGFIDAHIFLRIKNKIVTFSIGVLTTLSIMILLGGTDYIARINKYINHLRFNIDFDYEIFGPAGGFVIIGYFLLFSLISIGIGFSIIIIVKFIKRYNNWVNKIISTRQKEL